MWKNCIKAYYSTFNQTVAFNRNGVDGNDCMNKYMNSLVQADFQRLTRKADKVLMSSGQQMFTGSDLSKLMNIPWKFFTFSDGELPHPHTHGDVIFIPTRLVQELSVEVLIHEKIHLFQKLFPIEAHKYLRGAGIIGKHDLLTYPYRNPDTDLYQYDNVSGEEADSDFMSRHPLEMMAHDMSRAVILFERSKHDLSLRRK